MQNLFEALASTPRRKILAYLAEADLTAGDVAARFEMSKPPFLSTCRFYKAQA